MPFVKVEDRREYQADRYMDKYRTEKGFAEAEAVRKASWYELNRERVIAKVLERRAALREAGK